MSAHCAQNALQPGDPTDTHWSEWPPAATKTAASGSLGATVEARVNLIDDVPIGELVVILASTSDDVMSVALSDLRALMFYRSISFISKLCGVGGGGMRQLSKQASPI